MRVEAIRALNGEIYSIHHHSEPALFSTVVLYCERGDFYYAFNYSIGNILSGSNSVAATSGDTNLCVANMVTTPRAIIGLEWSIPRIRPARFSTIRADWSVPDEVVADFATKARIRLFIGGDKPRVDVIPAHRDINSSPVRVSQKIWIRPDHEPEMIREHDKFWVEISFPTGRLMRHDALECFPVILRLIEDPAEMTSTTASAIETTAESTPKVTEWKPPAWLTPPPAKSVPWQIEKLPSVKLPEPAVTSPGETSVVDFRRLDLEEK